MRERSDKADVAATGTKAQMTQGEFLRPFRRLPARCAGREACAELALLSQFDAAETEKCQALALPLGDTVSADVCESLDTQPLPVDLLPPL